MSKIEKQRDGLYSLPKSHGATLTVGDPARYGGKLGYSIRGSKWNDQAWLAMHAKDVEPGQAAEKLKSIKGKDALGASFKRKITQGGQTRWVDVGLDFIEGSVKTVETYNSLADVPEYDDFDLDFPPGVTMDYQPALDPSEVLPSAMSNRYRSPEIEGSFSVYYNRSGRLLDPGGVEIIDYQNGKLGHLRNLWFEDIDGTRAYCRMERIGERTLRVHNPLAAIAGFSQFVRDPNFGFETTGGSSSAFATGYVTIGTMLTNNNGLGKVTSLTWYTTVTGSIAMMACLYTRATNTAKYLITFTESGNAANGAATTLNVRNPGYVDDATNYVMGQSHATGNITFWYDTTAGNYYDQQAWSYAAGSVPSEFVGSSNLNNYKFTCWATMTVLYTTTGGGASMPRPIQVGL